MIVILGGSGYVGSEFCRLLEMKGVPFGCLGRRECNLYDVNELAKHLDDLGATRLINCAGYTGKPNVDACELDKANCLAGNAVLPGVITRACQQLAIPWGHVSSGCIFAGTRLDGGGFTESDQPNFSFRQGPCSFYSGTKALGEEVLADAERCYQWRLRIPFSNIDSPRNYLSKLMRYDSLLEATNSLSNLPEFCAAALDCLDNQLPYGIYNLTNPGSVTTSEVVSLIQELGITDKAFRFFHSEDEFMEKAAKTPRSNCVLDSSKAIRAGLRLTPVRESLRDALASWQSEDMVVQDQPCN